MSPSHIKSLSDLYEQWQTMLQPTDKQERKEEIIKAKKRLAQYKLQPNVVAIRYDDTADEQWNAFTAEVANANLTTVSNGFAFSVEQLIEVNTMTTCFWIDDKVSLPKAMSHIKNLAPYTPSIILVGGALDDFRENITTIDFPNLVEVVYVEKTNEIPSLSDLVQPFFEKNKGNVMAANQALQQFLNFDSAITGEINKEIELLANKKVLPQQEEATKQRSSSFSNSIGMELKNKLDVIVGQYETHINEVIQENFTAHIGEISISAEKLVVQINQLSDRKAGKNTIYFLPDNIKAQLIGYAKNASTTFYEEEIKVYYTFLDRIQEEVQAFQQAQNIQLSLSIAKEVNPIQLETLMNRIFRLERNFEVAIANKTPMELLMGARKNYMLIMMVSGMLGMGGAVMKLRFDLMPILIFIVGFGLWKMMENAKIDKQETLDKNLTSVRDALRNDMRRMLNDTGRDMKMLLHGLLKSHAETYNNEIEQKIEQKSSSSFGNKSPILQRIEKEETLLSSIINNRKSRLDRDIAMFRSNVAMLR